MLQTTHRVFTLQKSALRLITFAERYTPSSPIFSELRILKIFDLVKILNILFIHQYLNLNLPIDTLNTFQFLKIAHIYETRGREAGLLSYSSYKSTFYGLNSLTRLAIEQWNYFQLLFPNTDLDSTPYGILKRVITKHFIDSYSITD